MPNGPKVGSGGSLSPRGDWRAPSDAEATVWLDGTCGRTFRCLRNMEVLCMFESNLRTQRLDRERMGMGCWAIGGPFWRGDTPIGWGEVDDNSPSRRWNARWRWA